MTRLAKSCLRCCLLALTCAGATPVTARAGQIDAAPSCTLTGRVSSAAVPLPGVVVTIRNGDRVVVSTSTGDSGQWHAALKNGTYRLVFELRGFTTLDRDVVTDSALCPEHIDIALSVNAMPPAHTSEAASSIRPPPVPVSLAAGVVFIPGRAASINRALLRERAAALARGEIVLTDESRIHGLVTGPVAGSDGDPSAPLISARVSAGSLDAARPPVIGQRLPRAPVITGSRLYSATSSYTVAGSVLDSAPYQLRADAKQPKPDYLRQSVDFTVGGPLAIPGGLGGSPRTNATLSYSAIRGGNVFDQYATVPTAAMRSGDFSSLSAFPRDPLTGEPFASGIMPADRVSASARALLAYIPLPNASGTSRNFHYTSTNRSSQDSLNLRLTRPLAGSDTSSTRGGRTGRTAQGNTSALSATINGQVEYRRNVNDRLNAIPAIGGVGRSTNLRVPVSLSVSRRGTQHNVSLGYTRNTTITTNRYAGVLNVADSAGIGGASPDPFAWGIPTLSFATLTSITDLTPSSRTDERLTFGYSWSRGVGTHRIRVGADAGESRSRNRTDQSARGAFVFTGLYTGSDVADFLLGQPQQAAVQYGPGVVNLAGRSLSLYAQDDWRRWSRVTVNAGLRYELVTPFRDVAGGLANLDVAPGFVAVAPVTSGAQGPYTGRFPDALVRTDTNNVAPRVGVAWRLAPRTTLRTGYGVSFNTGSYSAIARQLSSQPPFAVTNTVIGSTTQPLSLTSALSAATSDTANTYGVARDYEAGVVRTWTVDVSRDVFDAWNLSAGVTRATGSNLDIVRAPNRGPGGLLLANVQPFLWQTSEGRSHLRSATFRLRRWYVRGISTSVDYSYSHSTDNASTIGGGATVVAQDEQNLAAEWGTSSFNRRHQLSGDLNFELPFGEGHRWLNRGGAWTTLAGRWSAYITFAAQSGTPLTARVLSSSTDIARGINGTLRADVTGEPVSVAHPGADRFFNTSAFRLPQAGTFGNAGRNTIVGPGSRDLSVQVTRDVTVSGTRTLSVQLRVTNVLNLVNYASVDAVVNSPTFGQVLSVRPLRSAQLNVRWKF